MMVQWAEHCKKLPKAQSSAYAREQFAEYIVGLDREDDAHIPLVSYNTREDLERLVDSTGYGRSYKATVSLPRLAQAILQEPANVKHMQVRAFALPLRLAFVLRMLLAPQPCALPCPCRQRASSAKRQGVILVGVPLPRALQIRPSPRRKSNALA